MGEPTRERVRATIGLVGGYWRPLAAVARLLEELGELAELLVPDTEHPPSEGISRLPTELADLWIITTALSDQFLGAVAEPHSYRSGPHTLDERQAAGRPAGEPLRDLLVAAGRIARIVNYYDGPKTPRAFEGWISLSEAVAGFHRTLANIAHAHDVDLAKAVNAKLDAIPALDSGRFRVGPHDPSTAGSLEGFRMTHARSVGRESVGPDRDALDGHLEAHTMRLWGSPECSSDSFESSVETIVADLLAFTKAAAWERLGGYVVSGPPLISIDQLDDWVAWLIAEISHRDPVPRGTMSDGIDAIGHRGAPGSLDGADRWLAFNGLCLAVAVFSPLYDAPDPRYCSAGTFALLRVRDAARRPAAQ